MKTKSIIGIGVIVLILILAGIVIYHKYYFPYSGNAPPITEKDLECGAYFGFYDQKKPGTPDDWVWGDAGRSSAWSDPDKNASPMDCYY